MGTGTHRPTWSARLGDSMGRPSGVLLAAVVAFGLAVLAVALAPADSRVAAWWPAAGASTLAMAWTPVRRRPALALALVVATAAANAVAGRSAPAAIGFGIANTAEAYLVAWWLTRTVDRPTLRRAEDFGHLVVATLIGTLAIGIIAGATVQVFEGGSFARTASTVMTSHAAALITIVPLGMRTARVRPRAGPLEVVALWGLTLTLTVVAFWGSQSLPVTFLPMPALVWCALRLTPRMVSALLLVLAVLVTVISRSAGPFHEAAGAGWAGSMLVQAFLLTVAGTTLPLVVSVAQHRIAARVLGESERFFRESFTEALLGMLVVEACAPGHELASPGARSEGRGRHDGTGLDVVAANEVARRLLAGTDATLVGRSWSDLLEPWERSRVLEAVRLIEADRLDGWRDEVRLRLPERTAWVDLALSPIRSGEGAGLYVVQLVDVTARREAEARLEERRRRDDLTGLPTQALLADRTRFAVDQLVEGGPGLAVYLVDILEFHHVNDTAGSAVGDAALVEVARRLGTLVGRAGFLARSNSDEFTVLRPGLLAVEEAEQYAQQLIDLFVVPVTVAGIELALSVSVGIAWAGAGATAEQLLQDAESAMHVARASGRRRAVVHSDEHRIRARRTMDLERDLRSAVGRDELEVWFQPVVDLHDERIVAAEALVRWRHPERGLLPPGDWLDVAESAGLMPQIGAWVLEEACRIAAGWPAAPGGAAPLLHANVSARQLEVPGFAAFVAGVLAATGLAPERLVIEVTETQLDEIRESLAQDLAALRAAGIGLAADDFGTGYSPLTRLVDLPVTMIKIDRRFVEEMTVDRRARGIVTALIGMATSLGLDLVAEGVEEESQAAELRRLGCRYGQGFLWGRPLPAAQLAAGLRG